MMDRAGYHCGHLTYQGRGETTRTSINDAEKVDGWLTRVELSLLVTRTSTVLPSLYDATPQSHGLHGGNREHKTVVLVITGWQQQGLRTEVAGHRLQHQLETPRTTIPSK